MLGLAIFQATQTTQTTQSTQSTQTTQDTQSTQSTQATQPTPNAPNNQKKAALRHSAGRPRYASSACYPKSYLRTILPTLPPPRLQSLLLG